MDPLEGEDRGQAFLISKVAYGQESMALIPIDTILLLDRLAGVSALDAIGKIDVGECILLELFYAWLKGLQESMREILDALYFGFLMGLSKTEVNLRRLLAASPHQQNQAKLVHYVTTSRELLEQLGAEVATGGISSISKAKLNEYSEQIEALASRLSAPQPELVELADESSIDEIVPVSENSGSHVHATTLRRRTLFATRAEDSSQKSPDRDEFAPVKLDSTAQAHIEKHRKLQDDLTDEMVTLAQQLKESSLMMNKSLQETEKILDSTEVAVEQSLASTGHANARAVEIYSETSKTSCFTWLIILFMTCVFIMVVLLIRIT